MLLLAPLLVVGTSGSTSAAATKAGPNTLVAVDWQSRLFGPAHGSATPDNGLTAAGVAALKTPTWEFTLATHSYCYGATPGGGFWSSPITFHGVIYIGSDHGCLYAINETTGALKWARYFGVQPTITCPEIGIVPSVNVVDDGSGNPNLYLNSPDGFLYKLNGSGATIWRAVVHIPSRTTNDTVAWTSPTVANGMVVMGLSSDCDSPFIQGQVRAYDSTTGALVWTHDMMPNINSTQGKSCQVPVPPQCPATIDNQSNNGGCVGAGSWYDAAVDSSGNVYSATASTCDAYACTGAASSNQNPGYEEYSLVKLNGKTGATMWKAPAPTCTGDPDYASSPVLFTSGGVSYVGATNKDGWFRVYRQSSYGSAATPVWEAQVETDTTDLAGLPGGYEGLPASGAVWDGQHLFLIATHTYGGAASGTAGPWVGASTAGSPCAIGPTGTVADPAPENFPHCWAPDPSTGTAQAGVIREVDPATGARVSVGGTPYEIDVDTYLEAPCSINGNGILACAGGDAAEAISPTSNGLYLFDTTQPAGSTANGLPKQLIDPLTNDWTFAQVVQEHGAVLVANASGDLVKWGGNS